MEKIEVGHPGMQERFDAAGTTAEVDASSGMVAVSNWPKGRFSGGPTFLWDMAADFQKIDTKEQEAILAKPYVIVEQAGHVGERDIDRFDDYWKALDALNSNYGRAERKAMHVEIAYDAPEGRTYEV